MWRTNETLWVYYLLNELLNEFIYWTGHNWKKVDIAFSEFVVSAVNWAITVTNSDFARFCKKI